MVERFDPLEEALEGLKTVAMKQRVKNIIRSYRNASDVIAEPVQNAMDELERAKMDDDSDKPYEITVDINISNNTIGVRDTGRGISSDDLQGWIAPDNTDKRDAFRQGKVRGHKGVGMTFLAYGFNYFFVESKTNDEHYQLRLENGRDWVESENETAPKAELNTDIDGDLTSTGTKVTIKADPQSQPSDLARTFNNPSMTAALLERQTAIGIVTPPHKYNADIYAELKYTDKNNKENTIELETSYRYPHKELPDDWEVFDLGEYIKKLPESERVEPRQDKKNRYRAVYRYFEPEDLKSEIGEARGGELTTPEDIKNFVDNHSVHVYGLFAYSVNYRDTIRKNWQVPGNRKLHYSGARIATDGMISSWRRDISLTRAGGNKDRTWLVYHFENIEPDLGRKDFPPEVHDVISATEQSLTEHLVNKGRTFLLPARDPSKPQNEDEDKPDIKAYKRRNKPLSPSSVPNVGDIDYISEPQTEQDVVALFNQLVGMNILDCYKPVYFDENYQYDSYFDYVLEDGYTYLIEGYAGDSDINKSSGVAEFKYEGHSLIEDIVNNTKEWTDIEFLVCWEIGRSQRATSGDEIQFVEPSADTEREYAYVTHLATADSAGENPIYTIAIKTLLDSIK